jgi:cobalt-zinc-cadmium efflux system outer membrane protein
MRWLSLLLIGVLGCRICPCAAVIDVEPAVAALAEARVTASPVAPIAIPAPLPGPPDLPTLWALTLAHHPELREAATEVEAAHGQRIQVGKYPNPQIAYEEESLGTSAGPPGNVRVHVSQEIVTAGKRRLAMAGADQDIDRTKLALLGHKFELLTRLRRAFADFASAAETLSINQEVVRGLEQSVRITRQRVEVVKTRPRTDLLRMETLLAEARIQQARSEIAVEAAWQQLAAEVGVPCLPMPPEVAGLGDTPPRWELCAVAERVQSAHTELRRADVEIERARLAVESARAEAVPNVQIGGGYNRNFAEHEAGAVISVQTALPLWDRKQGQIHEAEAHLAQAHAARQSRALRLSREAAEAFGRYQSALQEVERLRAEVLPRSEESLRGVRRLYQVGSNEVTFADVVQTQESLNETRRRLATARQELWRSVADLQGLMQLDLGEDGLAIPCSD